MFLIFFFRRRTRYSSLFTVNKSLFFLHVCKSKCEKGDKSCFILGHVSLLLSYQLQGCAIRCLLIVTYLLINIVNYALLIFH